MAAEALLFSLPDGPEGVRETLKAMRLFVLDGRIQPDVRNRAVSIVRHCQPTDWLCEIEHCWRWVKDNIRYVRDINEVETIHFADKILQQRAGDCDDASVLLASLLESIGCATMFAALAFTPGNFDHVLVFARSDQGWIPLDATVEKPFGWFPPDVVEIMAIENRECDQCNTPG